MTSTDVPRLSPQQLAEQLASHQVQVVDVREPMEFASGHIAGSINVPLSRLGQADLPSGPIVLVCQSGNRSGQGLRQLLERGHPHSVNDLAGGLPHWQQAGFPLRKLKNAPLPLMRQVMIAVGAMLIGLTALAVTVSPWFLAAIGAIACGLLFAGLTGICALASLLSRMPWNRAPQGSAPKACAVTDVLSDIKTHAGTWTAVRAKNSDRGGSATEPAPTRATVAENRERKPGDPRRNQPQANATMTASPTTGCVHDAMDPAPTATDAAA
mgnify:CR=1 FL=1